MEFLRKAARQAATGFKDIADETWETLGNTTDVPESFKLISRSAGKYALASQLLMMLNFPEEAESFRDSFNVTNEGPTGSQGFAKTPIGFVLDGVTEISMHRNAAAIGTQGFSDVSQTSTYDDLGKILPLLRSMAKDKRGKK